MIMGCEQCACSTSPVVVQVFNNRAGYCQSVIGACAASDLVEYDQAAWCCMMQDSGGLYHLYHEGTLARCQIILGSNTCEYAIHQSDIGRFSRNIATNLSHQDNQCNLAQIS